MATLKLTEAALAKLPIPTEQAQAYYWDESPGAPTGFGVVVGRGGRKTFVVRARPASGGDPVKRTIGVAGQPRSDGHTWTVQLARLAAEKLLVGIRDEVAPPTKGRAAGGPTLRNAIELHLTKMRKDEKAPRSIEEFERETEKHLADWLDRPLAAITRADCRELHEKLTEKSDDEENGGQTGGAYLANRVMRYVRAAWNTMLKEHDLPANPTIAVQWNKEHRRQEPVVWSKLPDLYAKIGKLENGIRRDYYLVLMFSGLRKMDAATIRWEHVNLTDEPIASRVWDATVERWRDVEIPPLALLRPNPKGGKERAFTMPLSSELVKVLERRQTENRAIADGDGGWAFPTETWCENECHECAALGQPAHKPGVKTHLIEPREDDIPSPHRWRDTYTTACEAAGLSPFAIDVLTNHRPPKGSVTAGYINIGIDELREAQEKVTAFLVGKSKPRKPDLRVVRARG